MSGIEKGFKFNWDDQIKIQAIFNNKVVCIPRKWIKLHMLKQVISWLESKYWPVWDWDVEVEKQIEFK